MRGHWKLRRHRNREPDRLPKIRMSMRGPLRTEESRTPAFFISIAKQATNTTWPLKREHVRPLLRRRGLLFRGVTSMEWLSYGVIQPLTASFGSAFGVIA